MSFSEVSHQYKYGVIEKPFLIPAGVWAWVWTAGKKDGRYIVTQLDNVFWWGRRTRNGMVFRRGKQVIQVPEEDVEVPPISRIEAHPHAA